MNHLTRFHTHPFLQYEQIPGDIKVRAWQAIILLARVPVP